MHNLITLYYQLLQGFSQDKRDISIEKSHLYDYFLEGGNLGIGK